MDKKLIAIVGFVVFLNLFFFHLPGSVAVATILIATFLFSLLTIGREKLTKAQWATIAALFVLTVASSINIMRIGKGEMIILSLLVGLGSILLVSCTLATRLPFVRSLWELATAPFRLLGGYLPGGQHFAPA